MANKTLVEWNSGGAVLDGEAGETYSLIITLVNSKGLRFNSWVDGKNVALDS